MSSYAQNIRSSADPGGQLGKRAGWPPEQEAARRRGVLQTAATCLLTCNDAVNTLTSPRIRQAIRIGMLRAIHLDVSDVIHRHAVTELRRHEAAHRPPGAVLSTRVPVEILMRRSARERAVATLPGP
jgi:hypothetical protein